MYLFTDLKIKNKPALIPNLGCCGQCFSKQGSADVSSTFDFNSFGYIDPVAGLLGHMVALSLASVVFFTVAVLTHVPSSSESPPFSACPAGPLSKHVVCKI